MMLQALIAYAERKKIYDADFASVGVRWLISLDSLGKLAGIIRLAENSNDKKPKKPKQLVRPNSDPDFVSHGRSYFLCDTLERSLLFVEDAAKLEKRKLNQAYFVALLDAAANECPGIASNLRLLAAFLQDERQLRALHSQLRSAKAKTSENAAFSVDGESLIESEELRIWWRRRSERERGEQETETCVCLATGRFGSVCRTTGFIKLFGDDTKLISFNKECPAFESFGLSQAANAPISSDAEVKFRAALNTLIEKSRMQGLVFNNSIHLHWTREPIVQDPIDILATANEEEVAELIHSVEKGRKLVGFDANAYYALTLSANGARIVVRNWLETTVPELERNIARWFKQLGIIGSDEPVVRRNFSLWSLLATLVPRKGGKPDFEKLAPQAATDLLSAALNGGVIPQPILFAAIRRQQLDQENKLNPARLALIKACLLRTSNSQRYNSPTEDNPMTECLNPESRDPSYLCGRLFAVFDRLQYLALGGVNAGVVERYYASASATPSLVMGRLFRNAQFHLAKAEGGAAGNAAKDFEAITCALGDHFPATLDLEGQGRFALGYYHQKAEFRRRTAERKEKEIAETVK